MAFLRLSTLVVLLSFLRAGAEPVPPRFEPYGVLRFTATLDTKAPLPGEGLEEERLYELSERSSLFGCRLPTHDWQGRQISACLEFDLNGSTSGTGQVRLRQSWFALSAQDGSWELLAGRTAEVIAPMRADCINFPAENWPGDIGQRRNLLRFTWNQPLAATWKLSWVMAATQFNQALVDPVTGAVVEISQVPTVEARLGLEAPLGNRRGQFSLWGHTGRKNHQARAHLPKGTVQTWSRGLSVLLPLGDRWTLTGEGWEGKVGDAYPRPPEISLEPSHAVHSRGGWAQLTWAPHPAWRFNLGGGRHLPRDPGHPENPADSMTTGFLNGYWTAANALEVGLEASRWHSTYPGTTAANDKLRMQLSLGYRF